MTDENRRPVLIMPCLDMQNGRVVKGVHFVDIADAGDPVECAKAYCSAGADALAMLDITATVEHRTTLLEVVRRVAQVCTVPFTVGGGIHSLEEARAVLEAGAQAVSISSAAYREPELIRRLSKAFGPQAVTLAIDVDRSEDMPSGYEVYVDGGRTPTGVDAVDWACRGVELGAGTILPTSKAGDGAQTGYDLPVIRAIRNACPGVTLVASGGAGSMDHFLAAAEAGADVLLAASVFHFHKIDIGELKDFLGKNGVPVA